MGWVGVYGWQIYPSKLPPSVVADEVLENSGFVGEYVTLKNSSPKCQSRLDGRHVWPTRKEAILEVKKMYRMA